MKTYYLNPYLNNLTLLNTSSFNIKHHALRSLADEFVNTFSAAQYIIVWKLDSLFKSYVNISTVVPVE